ncbi:uncharacterized protein LOC121732761 [Aricia agestis]|uniref:uncharacterized protein LOC121732761 n=1 Tax=Aricia agestis TaxID=91739 RepID=UPI001C203997|nr:uncharacterized protein LOC121732761 [Aricia agestis]
MKIYRIDLYLIVLLGIQSNNAEYIDDVILVVKKAFQDGHVAAVWGQAVDPDVITYFLIKYQSPVFTLNISETDTNPTTFMQTVFFAKEPYEFHLFLTEINLIIVNPIRIILVLEENTTEDVKAFTETAYTNDIGDIVVVSVDKQGKTQLSTYFPYDNGMCDDSEPKILNPDKDLFPRKYKNLHGCPVRVTAVNFIPYVRFNYTNDTVFEIGGFDGRFVRHIIGRMNATIKIVVPQNYSDINATTTESFTALVEDIADVMIPSVLVTMERYQSSQISYIYDTLDLVWCIPKRQEIYQWVKVLLPFYNYYTLIIIVSFVMFFISIKLIRKYTRYRYTRSITFGLYGLFFTQAIKFRTGSWLVNCLLILWVWFSFIVRIAYQGELIEGLSHSILEPATETVKEALKIVDEVVGLDSYIEFYRNTSIEERFKSIALSEVKDYVEEISKGKKSMLVLDDMLVKLYGYEVQVLNEKVANAPDCIFMRPRWPAAKEVHRRIVESAEAGLVSKITSQSRFGWVFKYNSTRIPRKYTPLDMMTLSSCFYGLMVMWITCFLILLLEISKNKYSRK